MTPAPSGFRYADRDPSSKRFNVADPCTQRPGSYAGGGAEGSKGGPAVQVKSIQGGGGGRNGQRAVANQQGLDLKNYLPGGDRDPGSKAGGFKNSPGLDIFGMHVNHWKKISERFREKCRLGVLVDCR